jgi:hypothetical protein
MEFLKKLIAEKPPVEQIVTEKEEVVEVEASGEKIGDYLLYVMRFCVNTNKELRDSAHSHGVSYSSRGGRITELDVGIINTATKQSFRAEIYPDKPVDTDEIGPDTLKGADIMVSETPNGPRNYGSKRIEDEELEQYLIQMTRSYLAKHLDSVVRSTVDSEFDTEDPENRRQMMRNHPHPDYD